MADAATKEATEAADEEAATEDDDSTEEFDEERALNTIRAQRDVEKKLKAELAEARKAQKELEEIKTKEADAQKTLAEKLEEREAQIVGLQSQLNGRDVKQDFERKASARGITDLELAYLAAKEQGFLGERDPKTGEVAEHNFEKLEERFPTLAGEAEGAQATGDAGVRRLGKTNTPGGAFNDVVRGAVARR